MALPTLRSEAARLSAAYRTQQSRRAAAMAALVLLYWRQRVNVQDPESVERWLAIMLPRIERERDRLAASAQAFAARLRTLEAPGAEPFTWPDAPAFNAEQVRTSLRVTGPVAVQKKLNKAAQFDFTDGDFEEREPTRVALPDYVYEQAKRDAEATIAGSVVRHTQSGARDVLVEGAKQDRVALGWVRHTRDNPCYFCAMLASRGLELGGIYDEDSFDASDPRFVGTGTAKVHDNCFCSIKPVYTRSDEILTRTAEFERMWHDFSGGKGDPLTNFRRGYEGRA